MAQKISYDFSKHCVFHEAHLKVLLGNVCLCVRGIISQLGTEAGANTVKGVMSIIHLPEFVSIRSKPAFGQPMQNKEGASLT